MSEAVVTSEDSSGKAFAGLRVLSLESRRAAEMARLIEKHGGEAHVSPSMREELVDDDRPAIEFAHRLVGGEIDAVILLTGVGVKMFIDQVERHVGRQRLLDSLSDIPTLARGPKPVAVMRELGLKPTLRAPAPNTWREVLATIDTQLPVANQTIGLQEYGETNPSLIAGLEARGARVDRLQVYRWALPDDTAPLEANARRLAEGEADVVMLTSANQLNNLMVVAERLGIENAVREGFRNAVVVSIGPTTSERLRAMELPVDIESSGAMGKMVADAAAGSHAILERKKGLRQLLGGEPATLVVGGKRVPPLFQENSTDHSRGRLADDTRLQVLRDAVAGQPWADSDFLRACRREPVSRTPVWLMRQAGRYMPEYRAVRAQHSFLDLCKNPALCSEVMCTAVDYLGVDAAIIFSDLLPILEPMGLELEFAPGDGPVIHNPVREAEDVERVIDLTSVDALWFVVETVRKTRADLPSHLPLIGFAGAPFTLASYVIEGGGSRNYLHTRTLMQRDEGAWRELMQRFARSAALYLNAQIAAGAQAVQVFDSWVGCLGPGDYRRYVLPYTQELINALDPSAVVIHFAAGNPELLPLASEAGGDVIGVDWRTDLAPAWDRLGPNVAVQGNLDPMTLLAPQATIEQRAGDLLKSVANRPGHVFNLGHGIVPQTPPENARALVDFVHEWSS
ncbi:uroporphyrinogen decarboxylase [Botrimarina mediterranea]|uniref:Uroporphyrinogen decarboxylase n=1 Tax=Botrimarina mediterranea TaxID=2528022 RepID=A0A518KEH6_9BACT|nr:uroporphyrinogen decarboxylase [Botrimarina mediterranea]QDV76198.1 Uroporphyrinogen decarboxylase [Botrimarina mediterranea]